MISINDWAADDAGSSCALLAVEASCSAFVIFAVSSRIAVGSFIAFSISSLLILSSAFPASLSCLFTPSSALVIAPLATSVSDVHATPKALRSPSNVPLCLLNFPNASPISFEEDAALSIDANTSMDLLSFNFLSSSTIPARSSSVRFFCFFLFKLSNLSDNVSLDAPTASNVFNNSPASIP